MNSKIVALLTDFGGKDAYVGVMKAIILSRDPSIRIVDLTHEVEPQDLLSGSYLLYAAWDYFPLASVFCAVVDPGVGSERGALLAEIQNRYLIAPDNGLISLLLRMYPDGLVNSLRIAGLGGTETDAVPLTTEPPPTRPLISSTFHGRDLFAPAAALCATGHEEQLRGRPIQPVVLPEVIPAHVTGAVHGQIIHIDRFGNCICSVHRRDIEMLEAKHGRIAVQAGAFHDDRLRITYSDVPVGAALCLIGSSGFLEIAVRAGSAAQHYGFSSGQLITLTGADH
jgi:S-adenosylmethionine hydrolase